MRGRRCGGGLRWEGKEYDILDDILENAVENVGIICWWIWVKNLRMYLK